MARLFTGFVTVILIIIAYVLTGPSPNTRVYILPVMEKIVAENKAPEYRFSQVSRGARYKEMLVTATAYTMSDPGVDDTTYSGLPVDLGVIAVDPKVIPLGSVVHVEGYGYAVCLDVGGAIKGNKIDVFFHDPDKARQWGVRRVRIKVYTNNQAVSELNETLTALEEV